MVRLDSQTNGGAEAKTSKSARRRGDRELMNIRTFVAADAGALIALWRTAFPETAPHNQPEVSLARKLAVDDLIYVAVEDEALLGSIMVGYDGHRGWLYSVCVADAARRTGLGTRLVEHACDALARLGCAKVNLQVREDNVAVTAFYEQLGFDQEPRVSMGKLIGSGTVSI